MVRFLGLKVMCLLFPSTKSEIWSRTFGNVVGAAQSLVKVVSDAEGGAQTGFLCHVLAGLKCLLDSGWEEVGDYRVDNYSQMSYSCYILVRFSSYFRIENLLANRNLQETVLAFSWPSVNSGK